MTSTEVSPWATSGMTTRVTSAMVQALARPMTPSTGIHPKTEIPLSGRRLPSSGTKSSRSAWVRTASVSQPMKLPHSACSAKYAVLRHECTSKKSRRHSGCARRAGGCT